MWTDRAQLQILVIDFQERLFSAMPEDGRDAALHNVENLVFLARELEIPVTLTEQYPRGLGPTVPTLQGVDPRPFEKTAFSALREPGFRQRLAGSSILVVGMETHVCVTLTVQDLRANGYAVGVVADGCLSRRPADRALGLELCRAAGAAILPVETVMFGLLERAGTPLFKEISRRIR